MARFCTQCGTANDDSDAFCIQCGNSLAKPAAAAAAAPASGGAAAARTVPAARPPKNIVLAISGGLVGLAAIGGTVFYLMRAVPPTVDRLLPVAQKEMDANELGQLAQNLCLADLNYASDEFNVHPFDGQTLQWMDLLAGAGLVERIGTISSGGLFPQPLVQYKPTPQLTQARDGRRLCLARQTTVVGISDVGEPVSMTGNDGATHRIVQARVVIRTRDLAAWAARPDLQARIQSGILPWKLGDQQLEQSQSVSFIDRDGQWHLMQARDRWQLAASADRPAWGGARVQAPGQEGFWHKLAKLFDFSSNPLTGQWQLNEDAFRGTLGLRLPPELTSRTRLVFTGNSMLVNGETIKCQFEVKEGHVKVIPEGGGDAVTFTMPDRNTAQLDMGLFKLEYLRVN